MGGGGGQGGMLYSAQPYGGGQQGVLDLALSQAGGGLNPKHASVLFYRQQQQQSSGVSRELARK